MTTAIDTLERVGKALFGKEWQRKLSQLVDINQGTVSKWMAGKVKSFDHGHPVFPLLVWHLRRRAKLLNEVADNVEKLTQ